MKTTKNIRYRGAVQPIAEYQEEVEKHVETADREYDGQYRGVKFHHDEGANAEAQTEHEIDVNYRGAKASVLTH